jgi:hypothetical protein
MRVGTTRAVGVLLGVWGLAVALGVASPAAAQRLDVGGFVSLRGSTEAEGPLAGEEAAARVQLGVDWFPTAILSIHAGLQARSDEGGSRDGAVGVTEAYADASFVAGSSRFRLRAGAFFLPTSFENVDPLWQSPYAVSSSALNTWIGEELRPVGLDVSYAVGGLRLGATAYRGNETLGALPPARGWRIGDRWTLLGEKLPVDGSVYTSLTAENDGRLGWAARAGWGGDRWEAQITHLDNRSDGLLYGDLFNWNTELDLIGVGFYPGQWTLLAEAGWGPTFLVVDGQRFTSNVGAGYLLASRKLGKHRVTLRVDAWDDGARREEAATLAYLVSLGGRLSAGGEVTSTGDVTRATLELRLSFGR